MFTRRKFLNYSLATSSLLAIDPWSLLKAETFNYEQLLSRKAYKNIDFEGSWEITKIDGVLPNLNGELLRIGPGLKKHFGVNLNHFFDGDAYLNKIVFKNGRAHIQAKFVDTPQRMEEQKKRKMIYDEFGTEAPKNTYKRKNQPNINLIRWKNDYLALSEGGSPSLLSGQNLDFKKYENFNGVLKKNIGFSAHPKLDHHTGKLYSFGIEQGISKAIVVYEIDSSRGEMKVLYRLKQKNIYMIHDMMITENHIILLIPPAYFKILNIIFDKGSLADSIIYDPKLGTQLIVLNKNGRDKPIKKILPASLVFHHGNAFEENGRIVFDSFLAQDNSLLSTISNWRLNKKVTTNIQTPNMHQIIFDLNTRNASFDRADFLHHDFPVFNKSYLGKRNNFTYAARLGPEHDLIAMNGISKFDRDNNSVTTYEAGLDEVFGEPIYIEGKNTTEDDGYLLVPGYDGDKDESFLDILDAKNMQYQARLWYGRYLPLGFHGNFYPENN